MKKRVFYILLAFSASLILLIGYSIYDSEHSSKAVVGLENLKKLKDVQIGMDSLSVLAIMGRPSDRYFFKEETFYNYEVPPGNSYQAQIIFDKRGKVSYISAVSW
ncbi:outer membrane protein assembly factor BamE domain-containing protein [Pontibacter sp. MBLB2868]|uniref:outer membrane protein assembly factor BamE domain-containing protein n=1 Tax=Pontibacter sp. MBLB2868 TaxID=3451555 RepID=UPI003F75379B